VRRDSAFVAIATLGFILQLAVAVCANGEEFFKAAGSGKIDLVYFGRIKDRRTGRSVTDEAIFVIKDKATGLSFPFTNDRPGHYRSPDVGMAIKEIGEKVDVNAFEVELQVAGYKKATVNKVPRKTSGNVELDFVLEPLAAGTDVAAGVNATDRAPYTRAVIILIVSIALLLIAWRTSSRLWSASD
jgi:hypothetical protein